MTKIPLKRSLRQEVRKTGGMMLIFGDINLKSPKLGNQEFEVKENEDDMEFTVKTTNAKKEDIQFKICVNLDRSDISFWTQVTEDDDYSLRDFFYFTMKEENGDILTIELNLAQAKALKETLSHYLDAYYSCQALKTKKTIKTERGA